MPQTQGPSSNQLRKSIGNIIYKSIDHFICLIKKKYQIFAGFRRIYTYKSKTILIKYCRLTDYEKNSWPLHHFTSASRHRLSIKLGLRLRSTASQNTKPETCSQRGCLHAICARLYQQQFQPQHRREM